MKLGNKRSTGKEQFYTPVEVAEEVMDNVVKMVPDFSDHVVLEPAGGTGVFVEAALRAGARSVISYDVEPLHPAVLSGDFLEQRLDQGSLITVSNPPFGRNNSLSVPFFNHAATYSDMVVFIVPRSWRKWTVINRLDRSFVLARDDDLDIDFVAADGSVMNGGGLRTCVQYWSRTDGHRSIVKIRDMKIVEKCSFDDADVSLTVFGFNTGSLRTEFPRQKNTTQMFLKMVHPRALEALQSVNFKEFSVKTAYIEALSFMEINYLLNTFVYGDPMLED
jgi:predicted RNA methylase